LPGLLTHLAASGRSLRDATTILQDRVLLVGAPEAADWPIDDDVLDALERAESGSLLRHWSAILRTLSANLTIAEELERRTAQAATANADNEEDA
jgi:hypothetical protein